MKTRAPLASQPGFTLLELVATTAILAILSAVAVPSFSEMVQNHKSRNVIQMLQGLLQTARHHAIAHNNNVLLCKSSDLINCGGSWKSGIIVFIDSDSNLMVSDDDTVLRTIHEPFEEGQLFWRSFGNKPYLEFLPSGRTNYQNGTFTYCIDPSDTEKARGISVTVTGRTQLAFDRNNDGIRENSGNKPLRC